MLKNNKLMMKYMKVIILQTVKVGLLVPIKSAITIITPRTIPIPAPSQGIWSSAKIFLNEIFRIINK